jgi:YggT family protein
MEAFFVIVLILLQTLEVLLFVYVIAGWFVSPYHPFRQTLGRIVEPFLEPIRRVLPQAGMFDFSPIALFLILYVLESIIRNSI